MAAKRIRTSTAKGDIESMFEVAITLSGVQGNIQLWTDMSEAKLRITEWLKQVDADQARLHKAMLACQALDVANNDADVRQATKLAREAIEG